MKVGKRHGVMYSSGEGEEEEFRLDKGIVFYVNIGENVPREPRGAFGECCGYSSAIGAACSDNEIRSALA
jgi:hypothetical protein